MENVTPIDLRKRALAPKPGMVWNPLSRFPRNEQCFCGTGLKFKACCITKVKPCCPAADAEKVQEIVDKLGWQGIRDFFRATAALQAAHARKLSEDPGPKGA